VLTYAICPYPDVSSPPGYSTISEHTATLYFLNTYSIVNCIVCHVTHIFNDLGMISSPCYGTHDPDVTICSKGPATLQYTPNVCGYLVSLKQFCKLLTIIFHRQFSDWCPPATEWTPHWPVAAELGRFSDTSQECSQELRQISSRYDCSVWSLLQSLSWSLQLQHEECAVGHCWYSGTAAV